MIDSGDECRDAGRMLGDWRIKAAGIEALPDSLSGGNQQKVVVAKWLATKPRVLLLDEPTKGVDVGAKFEIHEMIRQQARDGLAVLVVSSDLPEMLALADRILVMREGELQGELERRDRDRRRRDAPRHACATVASEGGSPHEAAARRSAS